MINLDDSIQQVENQLKRPPSIFENEKSSNYILGKNAGI